MTAQRTGAAVNTVDGSPLVGALTDVGTGLIVAAVALTISVSVGTLVFGAAGPEHSARGVGLALASCFVAMTVVVLVGAQRGAVATVQDTPAAVVAGSAAAVHGSAALQASPEASFATIAMLCLLTTLATALTFIVVGWLRLGALVRFLPYPVMGGFLAGTGWLLLLGGVGVMTGEHVDLAHLGHALGPDWWYAVLPGLTLALVLLWVSERSRSPLAYPGVVLGAVALFYLVLLASGARLGDWRELGLLLQGAAGSDMLLPFRPSHAALVDWRAVGAQLPALAAVPLLSLVGTLLNVTAGETQSGGRVDLDRELRAAGFGNLIAGTFGGMVGYHTVSLTDLNRRAGRGARASTLVAAGVVLAALLLGGPAVGYLPRAVVGGVVSFLGLEFLYA